MELQQRIIDHFHQIMDLKVQVIESSTQQIEQAAQQLFHCLVSDHKILCCGSGSSAPLAQHFAATLLNRYQHERPGLPCIALGADSSALNAIAYDTNFIEVFPKQVRALGQPGDVLVTICTDGRSGGLIRAIQAAHDRGMTVVALNGDRSGNIAALLGPDEVEIPVPSASTPLVHEVHLLIIHSLCDLIEHQLFGGH